MWTQFKHFLTAASFFASSPCGCSAAALASKLFTKIWFANIVSTVQTCHLLVFKCSPLSKINISSLMSFDLQWYLVAKTWLKVNLDIRSSTYNHSTWSYRQLLSCQPVVVVELCILSRKTFKQIWNFLWNCWFQGQKLFSATVQFAFLSLLCHISVHICIIVSVVILTESAPKWTKTPFLFS